MDSKKFRGNGKLLLTGEYTILDGAYGIALPTKLGQSLEVKLTENKGIFWTSHFSDGSIWFNHHFADLQQDFLDTNPVIRKLAIILLEAGKLNPYFLSLIKINGWEVTTYLEFDAAWGLGSSSTLIYCIAQWAKVDAFELLFNTIGGSGYDIACAGNNYPILYSLNGKTPIVKNIHFNPPFLEGLYFVYLNQKQSTESSLNYYGKLEFKRAEVASRITQITEAILNCSDIDEFNELIDEHENIISSCLKMKKVKELYFNDFNGSIKSLGAWGGDFVLASSKQTKETIFSYFQEKGFHTIIPYKELICQ